MAIKKVVHYIGTPLMTTDRAILTPVDHPDSERVTNLRPVHTSRVLKHDKVSGVIETENTIYAPLEASDGSHYGLY